MSNDATKSGCKLGVDTRERVVLRSVTVYLLKQNQLHRKASSAGAKVRMTLIEISLHLFKTSILTFRIYLIAIEVYKCMEGLNLPYRNELFKQREMHYPLRNSDILKQSKFNTFTFCCKSFSYYGAKV